MLNEDTALVVAPGCKPACVAAVSASPSIFSRAASDGFCLVDEATNKCEVTPGGACFAPWR